MKRVNVFHYFNNQIYIGNAGTGQTNEKSPWKHSELAT